MIRCQAGSISTVVARGTVVHDTLVIKDRCRESTGYVTDTAVFVGRQVCYTGPGQFVVLASSCQTTLDVARITPCVLHLGTVMIDKSISEVGGVMANTTILGGIGMWRTGCLTSGIDCFETAVMTGNAVVRNTSVIKDRRNKCRVVMTEVAILVRRQMPGTLAGKRQQPTVVAAFAATGDVWMNRGKEYGVGKTTRIGVVVTYTAVITGRDMIHFLAHRSSTVMTGRAVVRDTDVTKLRPDKRICAQMAD